jgi:hypothetical protein
MAPSYQVMLRVGAASGEGQSIAFGPASSTDIRYNTVVITPNTLAVRVVSQGSVELLGTPGMVLESNGYGVTAKVGTVLVMTIRLRSNSAFVSKVSTTPASLTTTLTPMLRHHDTGLSSAARYQHTITTLSPHCARCHHTIITPSSHYHRTITTLGWHFSPASTPLSAAVNQRIEFFQHSTLWFCQSHFHRHRGCGGG